jgi:Ca-activated chloride channel family protein
MDFNSWRARAALFAGALLAGHASSASAPTQAEPTFQADVGVIHVSVSVSDSRSRFLSGLAQGDFALFEDGVQQEVSFFTRTQVPLVIALLIDSSGSMNEKLPTAKEAAVRFIASLSPEDLGQVVQFGDHVETLQDFTSDQRSLEAAVRRTRAGGGTCLYDAVYVTLRQLRGRGDAERPERRAIVLLSDGEDTTSLATDQQVIDLARRSEIGIYSIGLRSDDPEERSRPAFVEATYFLTSLARDTGGEAHFPATLSKLSGVYGRIAEDLRSQYTLGYVSSNPARDGKWRRIQVRTPGRKELAIRHKVGYYGPGGRE